VPRRLQALVEISRRGCFIEGNGITSNKIKYKYSDYRVKYVCHNQCHPIKCYDPTTPIRCCCCATGDGPQASLNSFFLCSNLLPVHSSSPTLFAQSSESSHDAQLFGSCSVTTTAELEGLGVSVGWVEGRSGELIAGT